MDRSANGDWQRTSPIAVVIFIGRIVRIAATQGLPALVPLLAVFASVEALRWYWLALAALPVVGLALLWAAISYLRFQFRLDDRIVLVRQGVLQHERLSIDFDRVQNVSIREPFYMRPLGLAVLVIDTAGSQGSEITLAGIRKALADELRDAILADARKAEDPGGVIETGEAERPSPRLLLRRSRRQIALFGLTSSGLLWVAAVAAAVTGNLGNWWGNMVEGAAEAVISQVRVGGFFYVIAIVAAVGLVVLMLPLLSMAGALFRYYDYRLTLEGDTYRRNAGLLTRHEEALKRHKIQTVVWNQNLVARVLGMVNLELHQARSGTNSEDATGIPENKAFVVPALEPREAVELTSDFLPECSSDAPAFSRVHARRYIGKALLLGWTAPILLLALLPSLLLHPAFLILILPAYGVAFLIVRQSWSRWGYAVDGGYGFVRTGFIGSSIRIFPLFKMQRVDLRQSPGQRRANVAHLTLHLASDSITVPHVRLADALEFRDLALYHAESSQRAWY